jgi:hypothetical protein
MKTYLFINGIYGWGKGYLKSEYMEQWNTLCEKMCNELAIPMTTKGSNGICPQAKYNNIKLYMHPMDISFTYEEEDSNLINNFITTMKEMINEVFDVTITTKEIIE